jgi:uncharacterized protein (TIGR03435 family)
MILDQIIPAELANHLWQSTLFAAVAMLLTLVLRNNRAQTRYVLWLIASLKFLVPFSVFVAIGRQIEWPSAAPISHPVIPAAVEQLGQPFTFTNLSLTPAPVVTWSPILAILLFIWLCGFVGVLARWSYCWMRTRAAVRCATPVCIDAPIRVLSSPSLIEPGIFGVFRPVLLLPAGINRHLTSNHVQAILAHELCHVRRRDNFAAALHMLVEAVFWFHPLVWWIGARLLEERERACDEEVLRLGNQPGVYAESILKICQFYLASPVACVARVTGSDLEKRIVRIMTQEITLHLSLHKKLLLMIAGTVAIGLPVALCIGHAAEKPAQTQVATKAPLPSFEVAAIKVNNSGDHSSHWHDHSGKTFATNVSLESLIQRAYGMQDYQISGPNWLKSARYDIEAEAPPSTSDEDYALMVRSLLRDRFKLTAHRDQEVLPVYALVIAKNGPKLEPVKGEGSSVRSTRNQISMEMGSAKTIAQVLSRYTGRPVIDETGLTGTFKCELSWTPDENEGSSTNQPGMSAAVNSGPSIFTALQEQLGLKLVPKKDAVEILVVDSVNRIPTEN